jgi:hypothetical protein
VAWRRPRAHAQRARLHRPIRRVGSAGRAQRFGRSKLDEPPRRGIGGRARPRGARRGHGERHRGGLGGGDVPRTRRQGQCQLDLRPDGLRQQDRQLRLLPRGDHPDDPDDQRSSHGRAHLERSGSLRLQGRRELCPALPAIHPQGRARHHLQQQGARTSELAGVRGAEPPSSSKPSPRASRECS